MDFALYAVGGYKPWEDPAANKPRLRYLEAFRILSLELLIAQPAVTAHWIGTALGGTDG